MSIIDDYLKEYVNDQERYSDVKERVEILLNEELRKAGIMAIVSSRVKDKDRLRAKLEERNVSKQYITIDDINKDIADLVGARIALYFPSEVNKVESVIENHFNIEAIKEFPSEQRDIDDYRRRFAGYCAKHYRVYLKGDVASTVIKETRIEIQVASLLMHAWSEVEHDLVYKKLQGTVSIDEYESLDEINGLVIAGEISLQRLKRISEVRYESENKPFESHYQLASYIFDKLKLSSVKNYNIGNVDILFQLLIYSDRLTPKKIDNDLKKVDPKSKIPISQQIFHNLQKGKLDNEKLVEFILSRSEISSDVESSREQISIFLNTWALIQRNIDLLVESFNLRFLKGSTQEMQIEYLRNNSIVSTKLYMDIVDLREYRDWLVHSNNSPIERDLIHYIDRAKELVSELKTIIYRQNKQKTKSEETTND